MSDEVGITDHKYASNPVLWQTKHQFRARDLKTFF